MKVEIDSFDLRSVSQQLRVVATYLDKLVPAELDADLPAHQRLEYISRPRQFGNAARETRKKGSMK